MTNAIEASGLVKWFGKTTALAGVDLVARPGTVLGVLGPNGAGKTTAVRILATLLRPDGGQARVCGYDVGRQAHQVRQLIGLTGQYASVDEGLSGVNNLIMIGRLLGESRARARAGAAELLERFDLAEAAQRPVKTYSGGMRRRLDLAASLVGSPRVLFLDEPTTGLDPRSRTEVWGMVRGLVADGVTVLLTTQYLDEADQLARSAQGPVRRAGAGGGAGQPRLAGPGRRRPGEADRRATGDRGRVGRGARLGAGRRRAPRHHPRPRRGRCRSGRVHPPQGQPGRGLPRPHRRPGRRRRSGQPAACGRRNPRTGEELTVTAATLPFAEPAPRLSPLTGLRNTFTLTWRSVLKIRTNMEDLVGLSLQPIMFLVLFTYVFGGAIAGGTHAYLQFELPGLLVMTVVFATLGTGLMLNQDITGGVFDRFRTLPIARWAPLGGAVLGDMVRYLISVVITLGFGMILGFRIGTGPLPAVAGVLLLLTFALAMCWVSALIGMLVKTPQGVQMYGFLAMFPLVFGSNLLVPAHTMPGWLQAFVHANPLTDLTNAERGLLVGGPVATSAVRSLLWALAIFVVFAPLAVRAYRRRT